MVSKNASLPTNSKRSISAIVGIILIPFLSFIAIIVAYSISEAFKLIRTNTIPERNLAWSLVISFVSYLLVIMSYWYEDQVWVFSPYFRVPTFVIIIPFVLWTLLKSEKYTSLKSYSDVMIVSVGLNGIIGILFKSISFEITDFLGIGTYH